MTSETNTPAQFEGLMADLFRRLGFKDVATNVKFHGSLDHTYEIDILFGERENATVVEVKWYRYLSPPPPDLFSRALRQVRLVQQETNVRNSMLVMSCPLTPGMSALTGQYPNVEIWDAHKLFEHASRFPDVLKRLETLLEVSVSEILLEQPKAEVGSQPTVELSVVSEILCAEVGLKNLSAARW